MEWIYEEWQIKGSREGRGNMEEVERRGRARAESSCREREKKV
jgi:hypothetical protein